MMPVFSGDVYQESSLVSETMGFASTGGGPVSI
jgi:hypothetical protein